MNLYSNKFLLKPILIVSIILGVLNFIALKLYLFWTVMWFDMVMHSLGGFFVGLVGLYLLNIINKGKSSYLRNLFLGLIFVFIIGTFWEIFELLIRVTDMGDLGYFGDTGMDIVMDLFGGLCAVLFVEYKKRNVQ